MLEAYSVSHGKASAWLPVLELLRTISAFRTPMNCRRGTRKSERALSALDPALADTLPYLLGLLGIQDAPDPLAQMDPQVRHRRTLEAIKRIILRESLRQPLIVVFEDLHWIDAETQALVDLLADSVAGARLLLLVNFRPEYRHEWSGKGHYLQLRLDPLGGENARAMLAALLGEGAELEPVKGLIADRTGGNPFFIEEMVQELFDEGVLVRNGAVKVVRSLSQLRLPPTVQGILASRIDRRSAEEKELLQILAVLGREFPLGLVQRVTRKSVDELESRLARLQAAEFIYEQPAAGDVEYVFKHALTQEVAYSSVLVERRRQLHERTGAAIEAIFHENLDDYLPELAHHYSRGANRIKAFEFLCRAGDQAINRAVYAEGESYFAGALEVLMAMPESPERDARELRLRGSFIQALSATKGYGAPEVLDMASRARALAEKTGDLSQLVQQLWRATVYNEVRGDLSAAAALADKLFEVAQREGSPASLGLGHEMQLEIRFFRGPSRGRRSISFAGAHFSEPPVSCRPKAQKRPPLQPQA
jgi:predicted ATPase